MEEPNNQASSANKKLSVIVVLGVLLITLAILVYSKSSVNKGGGVVAPAQDKNTQIPISISCNPDLWKHVYSPGRLKVIEECKKITGVVTKISKEADGDDHILLKPDSEFESLLNESNIKNQHGDLVLEPVCINEIKQRGVEFYCKDFKNDVYIPRVGEHVEAIGSYVLDMGHGWNEIHPITSIKVI